MMNAPAQLLFFAQRHPKRGASASVLNQSDARRDPRTIAIRVDNVWDVNHILTAQQAPQRAVRLRLNYAVLELSHPLDPARVVAHRREVETLAVVIQKV